MSPSPWKEAAQKAQIGWKSVSKALPDVARASGTCWIAESTRRERIGPFPFCLPEGNASLNLVPSVRDEALLRFSTHGVQWHMGTPGAEGQCLPSTHLLDSQVQCVNVLLSLANTGRGLLDLAVRLDASAAGLVTIEEGSPIGFEWIGAQDYLGESRGRSRNRGRFATSADALIVFTRADGGRTGVLIEWKFTESYPDPMPFLGRGGTDRRNTYRSLYEGGGSPFAERPPIDAFFQEPHYQLLRQALLANEMVKAEEFGIDKAILLDFVPHGNRTLLQTVPPGLMEYGAEIDVVWRRLLPGPRVNYACMDTVPLFSATAELAERYGMLAAITPDRG